MTEREKYQLIVDVWRFWKAHIDIQDTDDWWEQLVRDGESFLCNHSSDAAKKLIVAVMKIIEEEYKCQTRQLKPMPGS